jgi:hypothetical protein
VVDLVSLPISLCKPKTPGFWVVGDRDLVGFLGESDSKSINYELKTNIIDINNVKVENIDVK